MLKVFATDYVGNGTSFDIKGRTERTACTSTVYTFFSLLPYNGNDLSGQGRGQNREL